MITLLGADDHAIVRKGIEQIIAETADIAVADEARNGQEILEKIRKNDYDLVLLDISLPGRDGLEILKELKSQRPKLNVLMLSMYPEEQYAVRALRSGASGYLTKESAPDELIAAINRFDGPLHEQLSDREYRIMCMIASGKTQTEIADELSLSVKTISTYRARMLRKMQMTNNADIIRYAIENNLS
jgi:DNA-binding NarL/FixJ family response regulator